jgi:hypothetical protein
MDAIDSALMKGNYSEAARLVQTLDPEDPWTEIYKAKIQEGQQQWDESEATFRELLRHDRGPKITLAARQGLDRLQKQRAQQRKQAIAEVVTASPEKTEVGVLILEAVEPAAKTAVAQRMAQVMNIDPYSARLILPSRGIRLYRSGAVAELEFYGQQLNEQEISAFWMPLSQVQSVPVYSVCYFEAIDRRARVKVRQSDSDLETVFEFAWSDMTRRVEGQLPIFEEVVDRDSRGKLKRKEQTQDYAQFCDLHLPDRHCILRLSDTAYQFNHGVSLSDSVNDSVSGSVLDSSTAWANWRQLMHLIEGQLVHKTIESDFGLFAEAALDHPDLLAKIPAHLNLFRRADSNWDPAFQLYSVLLFLRQTPES